eukprot:11165482-Lingulodinium_polyedra.AAC.1
MPPPPAESHRRSSAPFAQSLLLEACNSQPTSRSKPWAASNAASTPSTTSGVTARFQNVKSS